jgi:ribokinase
LGAYILATSLSGIDILVPGRNSLEEKSAMLLKQYCEHLIITLEKEGKCIFISAREQILFTMKDFAFVSHTAGPDCFSGALAVALTNGKTFMEAVAYALTASSLTMSRKGSLPALPSPEEIMDHIGRVTTEGYAWT